MDPAMIIFDRQTISGLAKGYDRQARRIAALKGVITKLKKELNKCQTKKK